jgi:hypothetical protein
MIRAHLLPDRFPERSRRHSTSHMACPLFTKVQVSVIKWAAREITGDRV